MTTTTHTRIYRTWADRLTQPGHRMSKTHIQAFARRVTPLAERGAPAGFGTTTLEREEAKLLLASIVISPVMLTEAHTDQGFTWLQRHGAKALRGPQGFVPYIVDHFDHFTWDGSVEYVDTAYGFYTTPIWTIHTREPGGIRRTFRYWYASGWREQKGCTGRIWEVTP